MHSPEHDDAIEAQTTHQVRRLWNAWMAGERNALEQVLAEYPHLRANRRALADLVYSELWLRAQLEDAVTESDYLSGSGRRIAH